MEPGDGVFLEVQAENVRRQCADFDQGDQVLRQINKIKVFEVCQHAALQMRKSVLLQIPRRRVRGKKEKKKEKK